MGSRGVRVTDHYMAQALEIVESLIAHKVSEIKKICPGLSPIEEGMVHGFLILSMADPAFQFDGLWGFRPQTEYRVKIHVQHPIDQYRTDFALHLTAENAGRSLSEWFAIECDGYEFHHKTREQVTRDKARERAITAEGFRVLRFSGTEIHHGLGDTLAEILTVINRTFCDWRDGK